MATGCNYLRPPTARTVALVSVTCKPAGVPPFAALRVTSSGVGAKTCPAQAPPVCPTVRRPIAGPVRGGDGSEGEVEPLADAPVGRWVDTVDLGAGDATFSPSRSSGERAEATSTWTPPLRAAGRRGQSQRVGHHRPDPARRARCPGAVRRGPGLRRGRRPQRPSRPRLRRQDEGDRAADEGTRQRSPGATVAQQPKRPCSRPAPAPPASARSAPPGSGVLHGWRWRANHAAIRVARAADPQGSGRDGPLGVRLHRARGLRLGLREPARHALHRRPRVRRANDWAGAPLVAKRNPLRHRQKSAFARRLSGRSNPSLVFLRSLLWVIIDQR